MGTCLHFNNRCFFFASLWVFIPVSYTKSLVFNVRLDLAPPKVIRWIENRRANNTACLAMYALRGIMLGSYLSKLLDYGSDYSKEKEHIFKKYILNVTSLMQAVLYFKKYIF